MGLDIRSAGFVKSQAYPEPLPLEHTGLAIPETGLERPKISCSDDYPRL